MMSGKLLGYFCLDGESEEYQMDANADGNHDPDHCRLPGVLAEQSV